MRFPRSIRLVVLSLLALAGAHPARAGEGFALIKKTTELSRTRPPEVFIPGTRIQVRATASDADQTAAAERLRSLAEAELLGGDKRFSVDSAHPQTVFELTLLENTGGTRNESRRMTRQVDTGSKDEKGKKIYRSQEVDVSFLIVNHQMRVSYRVFDQRSGRNLSADSKSVSFSRDFQEGQGAPTLESLEQSQMADIVNWVVRRLTPSTESFGVMLPRGRLDDYVSFAQSGLWTKYLDVLSTLSALPKKDDDAYRLYGLGLAYEALGYQAEDYEGTLKYLEQASIFYNQALEANPSEKYFFKSYEGALRSILSLGRAQVAAVPPPLERVKAAITNYQKSKEFRDAALSDPDGRGSDGVAGAKGLAQPATFTNQSVIEMVEAGLSDDVVLTAIEGAENPTFDVSPQGLIELSRAGVKSALIQKIQGIAKGTSKKRG